MAIPEVPKARKQCSCLMSTLPMFTFDRVSRAIVDTNASALVAYGYSRGELLQKTLLDLCEPTPIDARLAVGDEMWFGPIAQRRRDGTSFAAELCLLAGECDGRLQTIALVYAYEAALPQ